METANNKKPVPPKDYAERSDLLKNNEVDEIESWLDAGITILSVITLIAALCLFMVLVDGAIQ